MNTVLGSRTGNTRFWIIMAALSVLAACAQGPSVKQESVLYPELPQEPRIQFLTYLATEDSLAEKQNTAFKDFLVGKEQGSNARRLGRPFAVAHVPGYLFVLDKVWRGVVRIDLASGEFVEVYDPRGGRLIEPQSIFVDSDDLLYLVDSTRREVLIFNERTEFESSIDTGEGTRPIDVAVGKDRIYVTDLNASEILVFDKFTGERINAFGGLGFEDGFFNRPTHLTIDDDENVFVVDFLNFRFQQLDSEGEFIRAYGRNMRSFGGIIRPKGLDVDHDGNVYIADGAFEMVTIWDSETGTPRMSFGYADRRNPDQPGGLYLPTDVDIDYDNVEYFQKYADPDFQLEYLVYVSNGEYAVSVYGFGKWTGSLTPRRRTSNMTGDDFDGGESAIRGLEDIEGAEEP